MHPWMFNSSFIPFKYANPPLSINNHWGSKTPHYKWNVRTKNQISCSCKTWVARVGTLLWLQWWSSCFLPSVCWGRKGEDIQGKNQNDYTLDVLILYYCFISHKFTYTFFSVQFWCYRRSEETSKRRPWTNC